jgi:hypothetical protein
MPSDIGATTPAYETNSKLTYREPGQSSESNDYDMDIEDDDFDVQSQPQSPYGSGLFMRPAMLNASLFGADPVNTNGRIPTPIHPTFKRGGMNGLGFPTSGSAGGVTSNGGLGVPSIGVGACPLPYQRTKTFLIHQRRSLNRNFRVLASLKSILQTKWTWKRHPLHWHYHPHHEAGSEAVP